MGLTIKWDITYRCNLFCEHCLNGDLLSNTEVELTLVEVKQCIDNMLNKTEIDYIHFLGGEPLVREDFLEILKYLDTKNIKCGFNTNGLLLSEKMLLSFSAIQNLTNITLSIEGPNAEINDKIRGKKVFYTLNKCLEVIKNMKLQGLFTNLKTTVNFVASRANSNYIGAMVDYCIDKNVSEFSILQFIEQGNGKGKNLGLSYEEIETMTLILTEKFKKINGKLHINTKYLRPLETEYINKILDIEIPMSSDICNAGTSFIFIDNKGYVYPCDRNRTMCTNTKNYNLKDHDFEEIMSSEEFTIPFSRYYSDYLYENIEPCNTCKYLHSTCFPCHLLIDENNGKGKKVYPCYNIYLEAKERGIIL